MYSFGHEHPELGKSVRKSDTQSYRSQGDSQDSGAALGYKVVPNQVEHAI